VLVELGILEELLPDDMGDEIGDQPVDHPPTDLAAKSFSAAGARVPSASWSWISRRMD